MKKSLTLVLYVLLNIFGLVMMKFGDNTGTILINGSNFEFSMSFISLIGFISYIISFFLFTNIIVKFNLSFIMPITSGILQVLTLISGFIIFDEDVTLKGVIGALITIIGIVIINMKDKEKSIESR